MNEDGPPGDLPTPYFSLFSSRSNHWTRQFRYRRFSFGRNPPPTVSVGVNHSKLLRIFEQELLSLGINTHLESVDTVFVSPLLVFQI